MERRDLKRVNRYSAPPVVDVAAVLLDRGVVFACAVDRKNNVRRIFFEAQESVADEIESETGWWVRIETQDGGFQGWDAIGCKRSRSSHLNDDEVKK